MNVAVISDTHDRLPFIMKAVEMLNEMDLELVIHCGDYSAPFAIDPYKDLKHHMIGVYGNNDAEKSLIASKMKSCGKEVRGEFAKLDLDGAVTAVLHGHDSELLEALIDSGGFDVILYGHTHEVKVERRLKSLIVNPGELCGYLTGKPTMAILDPKTRRIEILDVKI
ncbi:metallophosphoesterase [Candidatus Bathyarchaeota archaeon]|nr:metallophosphoesterase [Candidatus Bathyarchaeota archaeon]